MQPLPYRRYMLVLGALVMLGIIACALLFVRNEVFLKQTKTYTNEAHRFTFDYPASFDLLPPSDVPESVYDESLSAEEREEIYQKYDQEWQAQLIKINDGLLEMDEGRSFRQVIVSVIDPAKLSTPEEEIERCRRETALIESLSAVNPEGPFEGPYGCGPDALTRELVLAEQKSIAKLPVGTKIHKTHEVLDDGVIIEVDGIRGLRGMTLGSGSGAYRASFVTYNAAGERIDLDIDLFLDQSEYPKVVSSEDALFREKAETDPRNKALEGIISSFKFLE